MINVNFSDAFLATKSPLPNTESSNCLQHSSKLVAADRVLSTGTLRTQIVHQGSQTTKRGPIRI